MARRDIVVIGASAGGVEALKSFVTGLPPALSAAVFVVLHIPPAAPSLLHAILGRATALPVRQACDGAAIEPGNIYAAIPDRHLVLERNVMRTAKGPRENRARPAVDVLFRSAAWAFGPRVIGVVLSGRLDDGTAGLWQIKDRGGIAIVQAPEDALHPSMPQNALEHVSVDYCVAANEAGALVGELVNAGLPSGAPVFESPPMDAETRIALGADPFRTKTTQPGTPAVFTCPECHGAMTEIRQNSLRRYRCHTGHAFSEQTLLAHFCDQIDNHLWNALRALDERTMLLQQLMQQARSAGETERERRLQAEIDRAGAQRKQLRQAVLANGAD